MTTDLSTVLPQTSTVEDGFSEQVRALFSQPPTLRDAAKARASALLEQWLPGTALSVSDVHIAQRCPHRSGTRQQLAFQSLVDVLLLRFSAGPLPEFARTDLLVIHPLSQSHAVLAVNLQEQAAQIEREGERLLVAYQQALLDFWQAERRLFRLCQLLGAQINIALEHDGYVSIQLASNLKQMRIFRLDAVCQDRLGARYNAYLPVLIVRRSLGCQAQATTLFSFAHGEREVAEAQLPNLLTAFVGERGEDCDIEYSEQLIWDSSLSQPDWTGAFARGLLDGQLEAVRQLVWLPDWTLTDCEKALAAIVDPAAWFSERPTTAHAVVQLSSRQARLRDSLPVWLKNATADQQQSYGQLLSRQKQVLCQANGSTYLAGIGSIRAFARQRLQLQMAQDHPSALDRPDPDDIQLVLQRVEAYAFAGAGSGYAQGTVHKVTMTLTELAIRNLGKFRRSHMGISLKGGSATLSVPGWMNADYLEQLVKAVDIGQAYVDTLKHNFVTDVQQARQREQLFTAQVPIELSLQALELSIKGEAGFSENAWRMVDAVFRTDARERYVDGRKIVLRPLAIQSMHYREPKAGTVNRPRIADYGDVQAMFIIGPEDWQSGPHVLYRPLMSQPLLAFRHFQEVLKAIQQPGELQDSVLAWMTAPARAVFAGGGLLSPHDAHVQVDWLERLDSGPIAATLNLLFPTLDPGIIRSLANLSARQVSGDYSHALFSATVAGLTELGDRESQSNAELRREQWTEGGWLLFNTLLVFPLAHMVPYVGRLVTVLGVGLQLYNAAQDIRVLASSWNDQQRAQAWIDLLANVAPMLVSMAAQRLAVRQGKPGPLLEPPAVADEHQRYYIAHETDRAPPSALQLGADDLPVSLQAQVPQQLVSRRGVGPQQLAAWATQDRLPADLQADASGLLNHAGKHYLRLGTETFCVSRNPRTATYQIAADLQLSPLGRAPQLRTNGAGVWWYPGESALEWNDDALFRSLGADAISLFDERHNILRVSGMDSAKLRAARFNHARLPALLEDTLQRFKLDREMAASAHSREPEDGAPAESFEQRYNALVVPSDPAVALIRRDFPGLPMSIANELLLFASSEERQRLQTTQRLPLRIAEEARYYLQDVRLARAYEGLYLSGVDNADTAILRNNGAETVSRQALRTLLNMQPIKPDFRSPLRLADGRAGYPLAGLRSKKGATDRVVEDTARALFPAAQWSEVQGFLKLEGLPNLTVLRRLAGLRAQYQRLQATLDSWVNERSSGLDEGDYAEARRWRKSMVAERIKNSWRRESAAVYEDEQLLGYELDLSNEHIADLPDLGIDLEHIVSLKINRSNLTTPLAGTLKAGSLDRFLARFAGLRRLEMSHNRLVEIPPAIAQMKALTQLKLCNNSLTLAADSADLLCGLTQLKSLNLADNNIVLGPDTEGAFSALHNLEVLDLHNNPLRSVPDLAALVQLKKLLLKNTSLHDWPAGLDGLEKLRAIDVSFNRLSDIPASFSDWSLPRRRGLNLKGNALGEAGRATARAMRADPQVSLGLADEEVLAQGAIVPLAAASSDPRVLTTLWLAEGSSPELLGKRETWRALAAEPGSDILFDLIHQLRESSDYVDGRYRPELVRRVWRLLEAAQQSSSLREKLFRRFNETDTCADGVADMFSELGFEVLLDAAQVMQAGPLKQTALLTLARSRARLKAIAVEAEREYQRQRMANMNPDEAEVHLAYRLDLQQRLKLLWQPQSMLFRQLARVTEQMTEAAYQRIVRDEQNGGLAESLIGLGVKRTFWLDYLTSQHAEALAHFDEKRDLLYRLQTNIDLWLAADVDAKPALRSQILVDAQVLGIPQADVLSGEPMSESSYDAHDAAIYKEKADLPRQLTQQALDQLPD